MSWASLLCQWHQKSALLHSQLHFLPPFVLTFFKTSQNSKVLGLNGPTRRLRVPLEMSGLSNHQCKNKLKLFFPSYSEAAKAVAKTVVMVNTTGPWCPKLHFLAMFKQTEDLCPSQFIDCHEQLSETRRKWTRCSLTKTHMCMKLPNDSDAQTVQHDPF